MRSCGSPTDWRCGKGVERVDLAELSQAGGGEIGLRWPSAGCCRSSWQGAPAHTASVLVLRVPRGDGDTDYFAPDEVHAKYINERSKDIVWSRRLLEVRSRWGRAEMSRVDQNRDAAQQSLPKLFESCAQNIRFTSGGVPWFQMSRAWSQNRRRMQNS